jgi:16S rRNA (guanine527-N7)-methyltransferase
VSNTESGPGVDLERDARTLGVDLNALQARRLLELLDELSHWNRAYNLTAVTTPAEMITHHLLDSLAIHPDLRGERIADVGTGAGFPGLPLALVNPARHFTLIDSSHKKVRFVEHAVRTLGLANVTALRARAESLVPEVPFDTVTARAFAPLPELLARVARLTAPGGRVLAMKGRWPEKELEKLPAPWRLAGSRRLEIPHLNEERCVLILTAEAAAAPSSP